MEAAMDEAKLKQLVKEALTEILDERREILSEVIVEALEDVAMIRAIQEGENTPLAPKEDILRLLEGES
jgi:predicted Zn-dependent protease with MMP-like domain